MLRLRRVCIALIILILVLTGCRNNASTEGSPVTLDILYNNVADTPFQEDWRILDVYETEKNVAFDVRLGDDADYEKAIDLNINAETPPDIILKCWPDTIEDYANGGLILPVSDYEHLMPYYQSYIVEHGLEAEIEKLRINDGKYYILPGFQRALQVQQWIYREDIFFENNWPMPTTYDELFDSLVILKELYPETTPLTASWGGAHLFSMMGAGYGIPAGWSGTKFYDQNSDQWAYAPATSNYREMLRFLNRCYAAGIFDSDIYDQSNEAFIDKIVNGQALVTVTWISSGFDTWNEQLKERGIVNGKWVALPVMESTIGLKALPPVGKFRKGLAISSNALHKPYFEDMMAFLDWAVYSDEGIDLTYWGIKGLTYQDGPDGRDFLPEIITPKNPNGTINITKAYGFNQMFDLNENEAFEDYKKPEAIVQFLERSEEAGETLPLTPNLVMDDDATEMETLINSELSPYVEQASKAFVTGELSIDTDWDHYLSEIDAIGYPVLEQLWNEAWLEQEK